MDGKIINLFAQQITEPQHLADDDPFGLNEEWRKNERQIIDTITDGLEQLIVAENGEEFFTALREIREEADRWV
jgi:hypothetical protein